VNVLVLREAVAALQRDQKRLDWLEGKDRVHIEPTPDNKSLACSLREAIDGAMAKEKASA
jgi:CSLREA domain-containing protein